MTKVVKGARFITKITTVPDIIPTVPPNDDHTLGWSDTDIYVGEWFFNTADSKVYYRDDVSKVPGLPESINMFVTLDKISGTIPTAYLPTNFAGALVYRGTWDASTGENPGVSPAGGSILEPQKGDYWIVNVSGNTVLSGEADWQVGDYVICNVSYPFTTWDKIDNSEPTIYANNVKYDKVVGATTLTEVDTSLNMIFDNLFITPNFTNTTAGATLLQFNGDSTNKWINWDGTTLKMGSNVGNSTLSVGPKGGTYTSTLDLHWTNTGTETLRWKTYSSNTDGYIMGYDNNGWNVGGTTQIIKISTSDASFFTSDYTTSGHYMGIGAYTAPFNGVDVKSLLHLKSGSGVNTDLGLEESGNGWLIRNEASTNSFKLIYVDSTWSNYTTFLTIDDVSGNVLISSLSASSATITNNIGAGSATITNNMGAGSATITNNMGTSTLSVSSTSTLTGLASYTTEISITDRKNITHKGYVDDFVYSHAVGWWQSGTTQPSGYRHTVLFDSSNDFRAGINIADPGTYNLYVGGNAYILSTLDVDDTISCDATINGNVINSVLGTIKTGTDFVYLGTGTAGTVYLRPSGSAVTTAQSSFSTTSATIGTNTTISGDLDLNGSLNVRDGMVVSEFHADDEISFAGNGIRITSDGAGSNPYGMHLRFFNATVGNIVMGMEPTNVNNYTFSIIGTDRTDNSTGGAVYVRGGNSAGGIGGNLYLNGGTSTTSTTNGGAGGVVTVSGGAGGAGGLAGYNGGAGGALNLDGGAGRSVSNSTSATSYAGAGGAVSIDAGDGGYYSNNSLINGYGGAGGSFSITSGSGGYTSYTNGGSPPLVYGTGGNAGNISIVAGNGGAGGADGGTGGDGGDITINAGAGGNAYTDGADGTINIGTSNTGTINLGSSTLDTKVTYKGNVVSSTVWSENYKSIYVSSLSEYSLWGLSISDAVYIANVNDKIYRLKFGYRIDAPSPVSATKSILIYKGTTLLEEISWSTSVSFEWGDFEITFGAKSATKTAVYSRLCRRDGTVDAYYELDVTHNADNNIYIKYKADANIGYSVYFLNMTLETLEN